MRYECLRGKCSCLSGREYESYKLLNDCLVGEHLRILQKEGEQVTSFHLTFLNSVSTVFYDLVNLSVNDLAVLLENGWEGANFDRCIEENSGNQTNWVFHSLTNIDNDLFECIVNCLSHVNHLFCELIRPHIVHVELKFLLLHRILAKADVVYCVCIDYLKVFSNVDSCLSIFCNFSQPPIASEGQVLFEDSSHHMQSLLVEHMGARPPSSLPQVICLHEAEADEECSEDILRELIFVHKLVLSRVDVLHYFWVLYVSHGSSHEIDTDHWVFFRTKPRLFRPSRLLI